MGPSVYGRGFPARRHLARGVERADSWATDAHKWLNVPYDSGLVMVRDKRHLNAAMSSSAAYLIEGETRDPHLFVRRCPAELVRSRSGRPCVHWAEPAWQI